ncbi:hypothetical protein [Variovorax sp. YR752]|uniref:hypothetical protein n=1 Tax=Variovorax sp. YR752 TaxID=1884383 RepID=UPI003137A7EA
MNAWQIAWQTAWHTAAPAWRRHLGRPAWLALGLLAAWLLVQWQLRPALLHDHERLAQRRAALAVAPAQRPVGAVAQPPLAAGELPSPRQRGRDLEALVVAAQRTGLTLERADYAIGAAASGAPIRVEATLPLNGSYAAVRRFVAEVLNELPHAALESLQLERASAQARDLQATARIVLFYAEESP